MALLVLNLSEAARELGISREHLEGMIVTGSGPKARTLGSRVFILREEFEQWVKSLPETNLVDAPAGLNELRRKAAAREESVCGWEVNHER